MRWCRSWQPAGLAPMKKLLLECMMLQPLSARAVPELLQFTLAMFEVVAAEMRQTASQLTSAAGRLAGGASTADKQGSARKLPHAVADPTAPPAKPHSSSCGAVVTSETPEPSKGTSGRRHSTGDGQELSPEPRPVGAPSQSGRATVAHLNACGFAALVQLNQEQLVSNFSEAPSGALSRMPWIKLCCSEISFLDTEVNRRHVGSPQVRISERTFPPTILGRAIFDSGLPHKTAHVLHAHLKEANQRLDCRTAPLQLLWVLLQGTGGVAEIQNWSLWAQLLQRRVPADCLDLAGTPSPVAQSEYYDVC